MPLVRVGGGGIGGRQTRSARVNGLIGRRVVVVVVELGSDIYLYSEFRIDWAHRAEAREKGLCLKTQKDCIMKSFTWNEGAALRCVVHERGMKDQKNVFFC